MSRIGTRNKPPETPPPLLERAIGVVSPSWAFKRAQYREALKYVGKAPKPRFGKRVGYDGAGTGRRNNRWGIGATGRDANAVLQMDLPRLRDRCRHLVRNQSYAAQGEQVIRNTVVGSGIFPTVDASRTSRARKNLEGVWKDHMETLAIDPSGAQNIYGLQSSAARAYVESGEMLAVRVWDDDPNLPLPFRITIMESDHLDHLKNEERDGSRIIQGKEYRLSDGRLMAYWLHPRHPGDTGSVRMDPNSQVGTSGVTFSTSVRVPAEDVTHLFEVLRPGQVRGVPLLAPCLIRFGEINDVIDAMLFRLQISQCVVGFVQDISPEAAARTTQVEQPETEDFQPGTIKYLPPGRQMIFNNPPGAPDNFKDWNRASLREVSACLHVTYENLANDLSEVNFTSGRMGALNQWATWDGFRNTTFNPQILDPWWRWFNEAAVVAGIIRPGQQQRALWMPPVREMLDPVKETSALKEKVRAGFINQPEAMKRQGQRDPESTARAQAEWNELMDELKLVLDTDGRLVGASGSSGTSPDTQDDADKKEDEDQGRNRLVASVNGNGTHA